MNRLRKTIAILTLGACAALVMSIAPTAAHHGWRWAETEESEVTGAIKSVQLGNPHGIVIFVVDGEEWTAEVGQPWRNEQAGLKPELLAAGVTMTIHGHRALDKNKKVIKAERVIIDGKTYNLYPDRD
jgi:hypothetical protein